MGGSILISHQGYAVYADLQLDTTELPADTSNTPLATHPLTDGAREDIDELPGQLNDRYSRRGAWAVRAAQVLAVTWVDR